MTPALLPGAQVAAQGQGLNLSELWPRPTVARLPHPDDQLPAFPSSLNAKDPNLQNPQMIADNHGDSRFIPLGSRGNWSGTVYEAIGYQHAPSGRRRAVDCRTSLLFNPYRGLPLFHRIHGPGRDVATLCALVPQPGDWFQELVSPPHVRYERNFVQAFRHGANGQTATYVFLGEFPMEGPARSNRWLPKNYVAHLRSYRRNRHVETPGDRDASPGAEIWPAFTLPGAAPKPSGRVRPTSRRQCFKIQGRWR